MGSGEYVKMDCNLETFVNEILGKWGFTMADWIYLQSAYEMEKKIQKKMNIRDEFNTETKKEKNENSIESFSGMIKNKDGFFERFYR